MFLYVDEKRRLKTYGWVEKRERREGKIAIQKTYKADLHFEKLIAENLNPGTFVMGV